jgi:hypothetical protein
VAVAAERADCGVTTDMAEADDEAAAEAGVVSVADFETMRALRDGVVTGVDALDGRADMVADSAVDEADALIALVVADVVAVTAADADLSGVRAL